MTKVLIVSTSHDKLGDTDQKTGLWLEELAAAYLVFKKASFEVIVSSMKGGKIPLDEGSLQAPFKTPDCDEFLGESEGAKSLENSILFSDVAASDYDAIYVPGGHGACYDMPQNEALAKMLADAYQGGKTIGSVCHGPVCFANVKLDGGKPFVEGKKVTGFSNKEEAAVGKTEVVPFMLEDKLKELGGVYSSAPDWEAHVLADGRLVTGQNPASSQKVALEMVSILTTAS